MVVRTTASEPAEVPLGAVVVCAVSVDRLPPATAAVVFEAMAALEREASEEEPAAAVDAWLAEDADCATAEDMLEEARATLLEAWAATEEGVDGVVAAAAAELSDDCCATLDWATACDADEADDDCTAAAEDAEDTDCTAEDIDAGVVAATAGAASVED